MKIGIIGGGASGMMLAALLGKNKDVTLLERNAKLGKKLLLTGNGKCNFTADDFSNLVKIYSNDFARKIYKKYDRDSFLSFMREIGVESKLEYHKGLGYYYPMSNKSTSVYYALYDKIVDNGVKIIYNTDVKDIVIDNGNDKTSFIVKTSDIKYEFDRLVISTGGKSYKNTGSDGSMYDLVEKLGYKIIKPLPGLVGFKHSDVDLKKLKGVRVDAKVIAVVYKDKSNSKAIEKFEESGEVQFTENYVSGIPMMNLSRCINRYIDEGCDVRIKLDLYNNSIREDEIDLYKYLKDRREKLSYRDFKDFLVGMFPDEISDVIIKRSCRGEHAPECSRSELAERSAAKCPRGYEHVLDMPDNLLNNIAINIENFSIGGISIGTFDNAQLTLGGVDTNEISVDTMESKIHKSLYFIGEVLDIDGRCGGYNLQLAYSTAVSACENIL